MKFIDLFAGLGGFHLALDRLGHECVFASDNDLELQNVYERNYGVRPAGDIRLVEVGDVPEHDILCAGFPCQPFSKAGAQKGFGCERWGDLFDVVIRIIEARRPAYFILENVPNIQKHDGGRTWELVLEKLGEHDLGYTVDHRRWSPHQFGIPQVRDRIFIVGSRSDRSLGYFRRLEPSTEVKPDLRENLDEDPPDARPLPVHYEACFAVWQEFVEQLAAREPLPSFPIWSMEFGATYPYEGKTPYICSYRELQKVKGSHGLPLSGRTREELLAGLPSHARRKDFRFPTWKEQFIRQNRDLYKRNAAWIDGWIPKILPFAPSLQKLEWNYKDGEPNIWSHILQVRASGVRVKRPTTTPSLIAMTTTQVPIVAWEHRFMTIRECMRLQSMDELGHMPQSDAAAFRALGNAVNADLVTLLVAGLLNQEVPHGKLSRTVRFTYSDEVPIPQAELALFEE